MAKVVSCSVPDELYDRWTDSGLDISPSQIFQTALEQQLGRKGQLFAYWSTRALSAEEKLKTIMKIVTAPETEIKRFLMFEEMSTE